MVCIQPLAASTRAEWTPGIELANSMHYGKHIMIDTICINVYIYVYVYQYLHSLYIYKYTTVYYDELHAIIIVCQYIYIYNYIYTCENDGKSLGNSP